jgi:phenol hydroxylase P1 protein
MAAESDHNRELLKGWVADWQEKAVADLAPLAEIAVGDDAVNAAVDVLKKRLAKAGL